jgi:hypothetical protein
MFRKFYFGWNSARNSDAMKLISAKTLITDKPPMVVLKIERPKLGDPTGPTVTISTLEYTNARYSRVRLYHD